MHCGLRYIYKTVLAFFLVPKAVSQSMLPYSEQVSLWGIKLIFGYSRISTLDQNASLQTDALTKCKCDRIFSDVVSGAKDKLPELEKLLSHLRSGDTLVVWKLDRLGRSLKNLIQLIENLEQGGIDFVSLTEGIDTSTPGGKFVFHIFGAFAQLERDLIRERTKAGLASARARGRMGGRPRKHSDKVFAAAKTMAENSNDTIKDICKELGISRTSYYRRQKNEKDEG